MQEEAWLGGRPGSLLPGDKVSPCDSAGDGRRDGGGALGSLVTSSVEAAVPSPPSALSKVLVMCCLLGRE